MLHDERGAKQTTNHDWTDSTVSDVTFSDPSFKVAAKSETNSNMGEHRLHETAAWPVYAAK